VAKRWAPFDDFVCACIKNKRKECWNMKSPASDGLATITIIESAYHLIEKGGIDIQL
jgi:hypothetical protein